LLDEQVTVKFRDPTKTGCPPNPSAPTIGEQESLGMMKQLSVTHCGVMHSVWIAVACVAAAFAPAPCLATQTGRYVRLEIPEIPTFEPTKFSISYMLEIEVVSGGTNVAREASLSCSTNDTNRIKALVDGFTDFTISSFSIASQVNPWIEVDLGKSVPIDSITIFTRNGGRPQMPLMWLVSVLDEERRFIWYQRTDLAASSKANRFTPAAMKGRFIGQSLEKNAGSWYRVAGEQEGERNFALNMLDIPPLPDAERRRGLFVNRDSPAEIERLCRRLHAATDPAHPVLKTFQALYAAGDFAGALSAYRDAFFDRLANPAKYGIPEELSNTVGNLGKKTPVVNTLVADEALRNRRVGEVRGKFYVADVGAPGATRWTPRASITQTNGEQFRAARKAAVGGKRVALTPEQAAQEREVSFFQNPEHTHGPVCATFRELISAYAATGDQRYLDRWMDYLDDWCLFGRADFLDSPHNLVMASEASTLALFNELEYLKYFQSRRPGLAKAMRPSTLVRYTLALVEDLPPYLVRARRAEISNWGATSLKELVVDAILLPEFRCMQDYAREAVRLAYSGFLHGRTLDGENIEAGDFGHRFTDFGKGLRMALHLTPLLPLDASFAFLNPQAFAYAGDLVRTVYRNELTRITSGADEWPRWAGVSTTTPATAETGRKHVIHHVLRSLRSRDNLKSGGAPLPTFDDLIATESDAAERFAAAVDFPASLWTTYAAEEGALGDATLSTQAEQAIAEARKSQRPGPGQPFGIPERTSDLSPYSGMYFLRDRWIAGAENLVMFAFRERSQGHDEFPFNRESALLGYGAMRYDLLKDDRTLVSSEAIVVDKKAPNASHGAVLTGGKTSYSVVPTNHVVDTRFHCSDRFNLAEARCNDPYSRMSSVRGDWYNIWRDSPGIDPAPITVITAYRQVFHVKGEGVWIVADRLEDAGNKPHEYAKFWTYPAWIEPKGIRKAIDALAAMQHPLIEEKPGSVRTAIPGASNLSSRFFGPKFEMINRLDPDGSYVKLDKTAIEVLKDALDNKVAEQEILQIKDDAAKSLGLRQVGVLWKGSGNQALVTLHNTRPAVADPTRQFEGDLEDVQPIEASGGVTGFRAVAPSGARVEFQSGPNRVNPLSQGLAQAKGESLLVVEKAAQLSGIALGTDKAVVLRGKRYAAPAADFEYVLDAHGRFTATPIHRAIDTVEISPAENVFADRAAVSFAIPTQDTSDIEFRYTLDGRDPTLESPLYASPIEITKDTYVKVRPFREGLSKTPFNIPSELAGKTVGAVFRKESPRPARPASASLKPGLDVEYLEGPWTTLFTHAGVPGVLPASSRSAASGLLVPDEVAALRKTDKAFALRYAGSIDVPETGVYSFHAPIHLYTPTMDAGYDLRVWVDGEEWFPSPTLHSQNVWSIPLEKGLHALKVCYVDYRWKTFKNEYWMDWQEGQMWQGTPVLEVSGPGIKKQPLPTKWLKH
jgi:hypothetical protein